MESRTCAKLDQTEEGKGVSACAAAPGGCKCYRIGYLQRACDGVLAADEADRGSYCGAVHVTEEEACGITTEVWNNGKKESRKRAGGEQQAGDITNGRLGRAATCGWW